MFENLTDDLLDLQAEDHVGDALLANVQLDLCCSLSCTCTSCE